MKHASFDCRFAACAFVVVRATTASASDQFPVKPVHIVVAMAPGGMVDTVTRLLAPKLGQSLGQPVIIENRGGGGGLVGIRYVKDAAPDGYTLLATSADTLGLQSAVRQDPGFVLRRDFAGVGPMVESPLLLDVGAGQPFKTFGELAAYAKANPDKLTYGSGGVGSATHFATAAFLQRTALKMMHVPFKGNGEALPEVMSGRISVIFDAPVSSAPYLKAGKLRALAVTSPKRLAALPDVPTVAEAGYPDYSYVLYQGLMAPAGTPPAVVQRLSAALQAALSDKVLADRLRSYGLEPVAMSPTAFTNLLLKNEAGKAKLAAYVGMPKQ
ncbi:MULTISPECIES: Bug family tripartite tricarboxylate transporter substrate binding protein [Burkholderia]|uniref:Bug family tripartite tricarboxylate transporter substrate binding protein n=1 Tax=Burkholderia TaxID=32008 RepID=UPI000DADB484|nr:MULTISPECIES: tripartite tricarboxylate transporter substrate binding protein [Burkholderia]MDP9548195.1 tripartite-type tricarboxylate transporter receptor subunit TctC [Burkholderia cepacia]MBR8393118.1 tripartite tricarboxylate transporter substrate binding protein [Burkholderia cenocepacia]MBR8470770.1 tripartite tricarboxylate transporter substrate binding protein [Burkholderia cenocepacia]MBR8489670.1 tripartite tricarboxylate transporter substrate binding protein [Burkholderia cenocep